MIFFTSDTHFGHENIIRLANRPFTSVEEMDSEMIRRWNQKVGLFDTVYHLGDFAWHAENGRRALSLLNGSIAFIRGNHDFTSLDKGFARVYDYKEIEVEGQKIVLFHYPLRSWNRQFKGSWHLYGHVHGQLDPKHEVEMDQKFWGKSMDVGVDSHNFYPVSFEELKQHMAMRPLWAEESGFAKYEEVKGGGK